MRPKSIAWYELWYLASVLLGVANEALNWKVTNSIQVQKALGPSFMPIFMVFVYTMSLILWYFTARSASVLAKWGVVVFFAFSMVKFAMIVTAGNVTSDLAGAFCISAFVLNAIAVYFLFRPDARAWFGEAA